MVLCSGGTGRRNSSMRKLRHKLAKPLSQVVLITHVKSWGCTHAVELLSPWDVASGQSVRSRVSGWPRGSWGCDESPRGWMFWADFVFCAEHPLFDSTFGFRESGCVGTRGYTLHKHPGNKDHLPVFPSAPGKQDCLLRLFSAYLGSIRNEFS